MEVSENGDIANWNSRGRYGQGAMDLVNGRGPLHAANRRKQCVAYH
jgi:hypothetical protein